MTMPVARVALDLPRDLLFDYLPADAGPPDVGRLVEVPFGRRRAFGVLYGFANQAEVDGARLRPITRILRDRPGLPEEVLDLLRFATSYYQAPLGPALVGAFPAALRSARAPARPAEWLALSTGSPSGEPPPNARAMRAMVGLLRSKGPLRRADLLRSVPDGGAALRRLLARGWVVEVAAGDIARSVAPPDDPVPLSPQQSEAAAAIAGALGRYQPFLLHGVTGSGKTAVYAAAIRAAIERDLQALLLVPEINLTPQLEAMLAARLPGARIVTLHSGLSDGERAAHWIAAASGAASVVLATRLGVFAALPRLGLIVVDEEHDASYKQEEGMRYQARDLAVYRARAGRLPVVLGSATPSLESWANAAGQRYKKLVLASRVSGALPSIELVDLQQSRPVEGVSPDLLRALRAAHAAGQQSLLFVNRRGYAPVLHCRACGWSAGCERCSARLVLHRAAGSLRCHHCGHRRRVPQHCPQCGNQDLTPVGEGTQRLEAALAAALPGTRLLRVDRDSTRNKGAWERMLARVRAREVDVLVGTQMLAKGHDFPELALVGVVNADASLYSADFRATERLFALLMQVSGRAGRAGAAGRVLVQTGFPGHPLFAALRAHDFDAGARLLLREREAAGLPPYSHLALLRAEAPRLDDALARLAECRQALLAAARTARAAIQVYEPVAAPMLRRAGVERAQLLLQARERGALQRTLGAWRRDDRPAAARARLVVDVDPLEI
jgi:primosomal protein N' (replication factor Y)